MWRLAIDGPERVSGRESLARVIDMVLAALIHGLAAYTAPVPRARGASGLAMMAKSESLPFLDAPPALDGSMVGDKGFDPLGFTSRFPQAITWFREAELKHGRLAMLATAGWLAVDMGIKFPGAKYAGLTAFAAHDAMVASGNMGFLLTVVGICEVFAGLALYEQAEGSGRPGAWHAASCCSRGPARTRLAWRAALPRG